MVVGIQSALSMPLSSGRKQGQRRAGFEYKKAGMGCQRQCAAFFGRLFPFDPGMGFFPAPVRARIDVLGGWSDQRIERLTLSDSIQAGVSDESLIDK